MRFYELQGGSISLDGHDIRSVTQTSLRSAISLVPDEPFLFSTGPFQHFLRKMRREEVEAAARAAQAQSSLSD